MENILNVYQQSIKSGKNNFSRKCLENLFLFVYNLIKAHVTVKVYIEKILMMMMMMMFGLKCNTLTFVHFIILSNRRLQHGYTSSNSVAVARNDPLSCFAKERNVKLNFYQCIKRSKKKVNFVQISFLHSTQQNRNNNVRHSTHEVIKQREKICSHELLLPRKMYFYSYNHCNMFDIITFFSVNCKLRDR